MSEFLLIAPGDATEIDPDDLVNTTGISRMLLPDLDQGIGMYDLNEKPQGLVI